MRAILCLATILAILPAAAGADGCVPVTTEPTISCSVATCVSGNVAGEYYVVNDNCNPSCAFFSVWIYEETNGVPGLQRSDDVVGDQSCGNPDTVVF